MPAESAAAAGERENQSTALLTGASVSQASAIDGRGTGYSVEENAWSRELTADGRVYYYNCATGSSQWHLPADLYAGGGPAAAAPEGAQPEATVVWPTSAKATLRVDCVTEVLQSARGACDLPGHHMMGIPSAEKHALAAIESAPRNLAQIYESITFPLSEQLRSQEFEAECLDRFQAICEDASSPVATLEEATRMVDPILATIAHDPPLTVDQDCLDRLASRYDLDGRGVISAEEFPDFVRLIVAVRHLEVSISLDMQ